MEIDEKTKNLRKLDILLKVLEEVPTKEEFINSFRKVIDFVLQIKQQFSDSISKTEEIFTKMMEKMETKSEKGIMERKKEMMDYCMSEMNKIYKEHEKIMVMMDKKMSEIKDGKDADEETMIEKINQNVLAKMTEQITAQKEEILKNLKENGLDISMIKGIKDLFKELFDEFKTTLPTVQGGRFFGGSAVHKFIDDETPSGTKDGVNTVFVLVKSPIGLKVFRGGARQRITEDFTLSNKTITFTVAPAAGEIILCDYRYF